MSYADRLQEALKASGMSQKELSAKSGVHDHLLSRYVTGERVPMLEIATALADCLDVSLDWMMDRSYRNAYPVESGYLNERVITFMECVGLRIADIARETGLSGSGVHYILKGRNIKLSTAVKLADCMNVSIDYLTGRGPKKGLNDD